MDEHTQQKLETLQRDYDALLGRYDDLRNDLESQETLIKLAILDKIPMPVWACDRDCKIVFWNKAAARVYAFTKEEALGKDFVDLFVHEPEREQARIDARDIIDNDRFIKNMAEDIDRNGSTKKLVTQCFALYDVGGHVGLQAEVSYEVQDIDRLQIELKDLQDKFARERQRVRELEEESLKIIRKRALECLDSIYKNQSDRLIKKEDKLIEARLTVGNNKAASQEIQREIDDDRKKLISWEKIMRGEIMANNTVDGLEDIAGRVERREGLDV